MAMKQFDEILREKVKEVFSNYNADHLAEKGWQSFVARRRKKFPGVLFIMPLWAKAASLAILISVGTLLTYKIVNRQNEAPITGIRSEEVEKQKESIAPETSVEAKTEVAEKLSASGDKSYAEKIIDRQVSVNSVITVGINGEIVSKPAEFAHNEIFKIADNEPIAGLPDTGKIQKPDARTESPLNEPDSVLMAEALKNYTETGVSEEEKKGKSHKNKSSVIAGVSGMMAVIDNALATTPGVSAGFYYEYQFTRRIAIRPGVAIAMHSSPVENRTGRTNLNYAAPLYDGTTGTTDSYEASLRLVALELPVNMVFNVIAKEKSSLFLSAGASTLICLSQKFTGTFVNSYTKTVTNSVTGEMMTYSNYSTVEVEKTERAFSHTDYFGLANISAGYSLPFGRGSLLIEPYVQMPLSGITSLDVKIYYSGISLKLKFGK
ncbi:MAG TPA: outer membrane beta-barrel protein [Bacteroidales bacterium]|nr:outer membrane beta-barrel protein [Bacteroidales bacterium]